jgi:thiol-disulfide isomerase/thioredoxin
MKNKAVTQKIVLLVSIGVLCLVIGLGLWYLYFVRGQETGEEVANNPNNPSVSNPGRGGNNFPGNSGSSQNGSGALNQNSRYVEYTEGMLNDLEEGEQAVLFFKAEWCSTCSGLDEDIQANASQIPEGYYIIEVDYDEELALIAKYEATVQHTLVLVNYRGEMLRKWVGSPTLEVVLSQSVPVFEDESGFPVS